MKRLLAAFMLFTRLPLWRISPMPEPACFNRAVVCWPVVGWLTGTVTAGIYYLAGTYLFPPATALLLALLGRVLLTGALHEDGLADFIDGVGGGTTRERMLEIMKDSRIGTYGVIGLIFYFGILYLNLSSLPMAAALPVLFAGDAWGKYCASRLIDRLPYARAESKNLAKYDRMTRGEHLSALLAGALPLLLCIAWYTSPSGNPAAVPGSASGSLPALFSLRDPSLLPEFGRILRTALIIATAVSFIIVLMIIRLLHKKLSGYTGDCCGAAFLLCELGFQITAAAVFHVCSGPMMP